MPEITTQDIDEPLLTSEDQYLSCGVHIGTQQKNKVMEPFIYRVRSDGLFVLDVKKTNDRILAAAKFLSRFQPSQVLFVSARQYGQKPIRLLADTLGCRAIPGRFMPGTLTNPNTSQFFEPDVIVLNDPIGDAQALREAINIGIPVVAMVDTNNELRNVDLAVPTNNKGRRSLALVYYLLCRELGKNWGQYESDEAFELTVDDFEASL